MDWRWAVAKKAIVGRVPFADALRRLKRDRLGYAPDLSNLDTTVENFALMSEVARAAGLQWQGARVLEIGSGWFPVIPLLMWKAGARAVTMTDLNPHFDAVTFAATLDYLRRSVPGFTSLRAGADPADYGLRYLAPFDPSQVPDGSIDVVTSRTVLEHIDPAPLVALLRALRPKLAPGGCMVHLVDHSDHLQHLDPSISRIHFLTWNARFHARINRLIKEGENRLRHHQYPDLFADAGFEVVREWSEVDAATLARVPSLALQPPFAQMTPQQLSVLTSVYVLRPSA